MNKFLKIFQITTFLAIVFVLSFNIVLAQVTEPNLQVNFGPVPIDFSTGCKYIEGEGGERICQISWIGDYIDAVYRYGVGLAVILAVVGVMIGGFAWLASAGNPGRITTAKSIIGSSFAGLFLALFSFVILNTINPRLISLDPIEVRSIKPADLTLKDFDSTYIGCCERRARRTRIFSCSTKQACEEKVSGQTFESWTPFIAECSLVTNCNTRNSALR